MLKIEDAEIKTWDKHISSIVECTIRNNVFSCSRNDQTSFHSDIYKYEDISIVTNRESRFGEFYYSLAAYDDSAEKAWPLLTLPAKFDISVKRFEKGLFLIWTDSCDPAISDMKQCSFCHVHDNEKADNITVDFNALKGIHILPGHFVLLAYMQKVGGTGGVRPREINTFAFYEPTGKLIKTLYEYYSDDKETFDYIFNAAKTELFLIRKVNGNEKGKERVLLSLLCKSGDGESGSRPEPETKSGADDEGKGESENADA